MRRIWSSNMENKSKMADGRHLEKHVLHRRLHYIKILKLLIFEIMRGRLYSSCVRSSVLHGSETWPIRKENEVALQRAEMRMVRWMCGVKLQDKTSK